MLYRSISLRLNFKHYCNVNCFRLIHVCGTALNHMFGMTHSHVEQNSSIYTIVDVFSGTEIIYFLISGTEIIYFLNIIRV